MRETKTTVWATQKPWLTREIHRILRVRNTAFRAGDRPCLFTARASLECGIKGETRQDSGAKADHFRDSRSLWRGIQTFMD